MGVRSDFIEMTSKLMGSGFMAGSCEFMMGRECMEAILAETS